MGEYTVDARDYKPACGGVVMRRKSATRMVRVCPSTLRDLKRVRKAEKLETMDAAIRFLIDGSHPDPGSAEPRRTP